MQNLSLEKIKSLLASDIDGVVFDSISSTNDYLKGVASQSNGEFFAVAKEQSGGKGTRGRSFYSPNGGVYLSMLLRPSLKANKLALITPYAAVVAANAVEKASNLSVKIKWVNDLYIGDKKLAGILTEASLNGDNCNYVIVGIGLNVTTNNFPSELKGIATSLSLEGANNVDVNQIIANVINGVKNLESELLSGNFMAEYKSRQTLMGKEVTVSGGSNVLTGVAVDVDNSGALVLKCGCETVLVSAGDVSLKL